MRYVQAKKIGLFGLQKKGEGLAWNAMGEMVDLNLSSHSHDDLSASSIPPVVNNPWIEKEQTEMEFAREGSFMRERCELDYLDNEVLK